MMGLLNDRSSLSILPRKRTIEHGGCQGRGFQPNFKRLKVDDASRISGRKTEGVTVMAATRNSKVGSEGGVIGIKSPRISVPWDPKFDGKVDAAVPNMTPKNMEMGLPVELGKAELAKVWSTGNRKVGSEGGVVAVKPTRISPLVSHGKVDETLPNMAMKNVEMGSPMKAELAQVGVNGFQAKQIDVLASLESLSHRRPLARLYPPPKIRKGIPVTRKFPPGCGRLNHLSSSKSKDLANGKSGVELRSLVENSGKDDKQIRERINDDGCVFGREFADEFEGDPRMRKNSEKCSMDKFAHDGTGFMICSQGVESSDLVPSFDGGLTAKQQGKRVSDTEATCRYEGQKYEFTGADESKLVFLKKDETKVSEQNSTQEKSLTIGVEAANQFKGVVLGYSGKLDYILEAKELNDPSIGPLSDYQANVSRNKVLETLNLFKEIYENMSKEHNAKSKGQGEAPRQIYVEAAMLLKQNQKWVNTQQVLGAVPGVEVNDQFQFRAELAIIGQHHQFTSGIDYMKKDGKILATSIVNSGRYANETESSDVLIYSGQGGNPNIDAKKPEDQKLERGNLALKNSMDAGTPVRVIRGRNLLKASNTIDANIKEASTYIYDGLYIVSKCLQERGQYGKLVFKFHLNRIPGQPKLKPYIVTRSIKSKGRNNHCVVDDISQGKEEMPIRTINDIDDERPPPFKYIAHMIYPESFNLSKPSGCNCEDGCSDCAKCSCARKKEGNIPLNNNEAATKVKPIVYECGPSCKCPSSCKNRVSQRGIRYKLEIFKTESRGWGVRSRSFISSGSFICEYVGELLREKQAEERRGFDEYLFHIGNNINDDRFAIDAAQRGNVGRFINHSCSPNLNAQRVLHDHDDKRVPHIMLFASKNITPLRELTYDYNYKRDQVRDVNGNIKNKNCYCGAPDCTGKMYRKQL